MANRIAFAVLLFAMGAYYSIRLFVDSWEGGYCWGLGTQNYVRLPFQTAFLSAWDAMLSQAARAPSHLVFVGLGLTAFLWLVTAVLITDSTFVRASAFLLVAVPFALLGHDQISFGIDAYCDGHGDVAVGFFGLQLMCVLPLGFILFVNAIWRMRKSGRPKTP